MFMALTPVLDVCGYGCREPRKLMFADPNFLGWSRREDLNAPSAEYDSAALALSYTGLGAYNIIPHRPKIQSGGNETRRKNPDQSPVQVEPEANTTPCV